MQTYSTSPYSSSCELISKYPVYSSIHTSIHRSFITASPVTMSPKSIPANSNVALYTNIVQFPKYLDLPADLLHTALVYIFNFLKSIMTVVPWLAAWCLPHRFWRSVGHPGGPFLLQVLLRVAPPRRSPPARLPRAGSLPMGWIPQENRCRLWGHIWDDMVLPRWVMLTFLGLIQEEAYLRSTFSKIKTQIWPVDH